MQHTTHFYISDFKKGAIEMTKKILAVTFAIFLIALLLLTSFSKKSDFSESENRELASLPNFSLASILDKSFMNGFDTYFSDHFFGRSFWVNLKSNIELISLKKENNSILLTEKDTLVEDLKKPDERKLAQNIDGILRFKEKNPDAKIYTAIAPTACDIYGEYLPYGKKTWNQKEVLNSFYNDISSASFGIDLYSTLSAKKDQYIYYGTDHHWTSLGAYYAYNQIASSLDFKPYEKSSFDIEHATDSFYGTFSSKSNISVKPDTIDIYKPAKPESTVTEVVVNNGKTVKTYSDLYFREWLSKKDKYSVFLGQVQPEITLKTNVQNNKKLLIFKDSFAHSLVPFLALHYSEIKLIDLRYTNQHYSEFVNITDYDNVLLLYNIESITHNNDIAALGD